MGNNETVLTLRIDVADRDRRIDELKSLNARYAQTISDRFDIIKALRIDVSDRDHHTEELKATIVRLNDQIRAVMDTMSYICDACNHGQCVLTVEGESDVPDYCPYDNETDTNWRIEQ